MPDLDYKNSGYGGLFGWLGRPELKTLAHMHTDVELNFVLQGQVTYLMGGQILPLLQNDIAIFWAVTPHCIIAVGKNARIGVVHVPLGEFLRWEFPWEFVDPILHGHGLYQLSDQPEQDQLHFATWAADMNNGFAKGNDEVYKTVLLEVQARLWRMVHRNLAHSPTHKTISPDPSKLPKIEQVAIYVALNYQLPLSIKDITQVVGLHPNYIMNLFRKMMGQTLTDYLNMHRLAHAQRLLISSKRSILDVALDSGFGSLSRFYAVFKLSVGMTPKQYRATYGLAPNLLGQKVSLGLVSGEMMPG